jgi:adenine-specific DNA-methyltransferase
MSNLTCATCFNVFLTKSDYKIHSKENTKCKTIKIKIINNFHQMGQYFTKNDYLKKCVYDLILNNPLTILEPSIGRGDLVEYILSKNIKIIFDKYEIDNTIKLLDCITKSEVVFSDFVKCKIDKKYTTIVGNPPYVKKKGGNLYLLFIEKCFNLLEENGELIFIVPSDFIKLTSSSKIINNMLKNGTFTHIIQPNNENYFENAKIDVIIFRYCKNKKLENNIIINNENKYLINTNGVLTFSKKKEKEKDIFKDFFDIYVGMVTGKESVFKNSKYGNVNILNSFEKEEKYILITTFPTHDKNIDSYLLKHKEILINRKIKKFNEKNWFEWGALRNYKSVLNNIGKKCVFIKNMTRKNEVAFIDDVKLFGGSLIMLIPKKDIDLKKIVNYLNSDEFKINYTYAGRFKIGHKQLCNCLFNHSNFL